MRLEQLKTGLLSLILLVLMLALPLLTWKTHLFPYKRTPLGYDQEEEEGELPVILPPRDLYHSEKTLMNLTNFKFLILDRFNHSEHRLWVIMVSSATGHFKHRKTIRNKWGKNRQVVFLLGMPSSKQETLKMEIREEAGRYGDIVQGDFIDSYRNLTYKHMMGFLWAMTFCPEVTFIIKTDDDVFTNTPYLETYLRSLPKDQSLLTCMVHSSATHREVRREKSSKWRVTREEYSEDMYPIFCAGWSIIYTQDVIRKLFSKAQNELYFWIDDVFLTGIIAEKLNITRTPLELMAASKRRTQDILKWGPSYYFLFCDSTPEEFGPLWEMVNDVTSNDL